MALRNSSSRKRWTWFSVSLICMALVLSAGGPLFLLRVALCASGLGTCPFRAPMAEGAINISAALGFGYLIGYEGVILGSILSQVIIICIWKPILLFRDGLKLPVWNYFQRVVIRYMVIVADIIALSFLFDWILPHRFSSYLSPKIDL